MEQVIREFLHIFGVHWWNHWTEEEYDELRQMRWQSRYCYICNKNQYNHD